MEANLSNVTRKTLLRGKGGITGIFMNQLLSESNAEFSVHWLSCRKLARGTTAVQIFLNIS